MTEYDYSPAAYERYVAQQARVSHWVADTVQQAHGFSNPFVLSPTLRDRSFYDDPDDVVPPVPPRPPPSRSKTADHWSRPSRERTRSFVDRPRQPDHDRSSSSRHRSHSHSRSSSTPRDAQIVYQPHPSQPYVYPQPHVVSRTPAPRTHASPPLNYQYPTGPAPTPARQIYLTQPQAPPPPGQVYHASPPLLPAQPKDQLHRRASQTRHLNLPPQPYLLVQGGGPKAEYKRGPPIHAPVPTRPHAQQPLLKRLLGFVTMSPVGGRSGNARGPRGSSY